MNPSELLPLIEAGIRQQAFGEKPKSLYEPIRYIMGLGGKRMRPLLTCLSYSLYRTDIKRVVPFAVAIEAFHNFTLMHDDIMDKAPLRRGKRTVHEKWNTSTAILSGDTMLVKVYELLIAQNPPRLEDLLSRFNRAALEVCEGQQWDMQFESDRKVSEQDYISMIRQKTAVLIGFSLELGAMLAEAPAEDQAALNDFGINIGIGFQLHDDLLDVYGDRKKFGKLVGGDIISNKKTFLLVKAMELARGKTKSALNQWLNAKKFRNEKKVAAVKAIYDSLGIPAIAEKRIAEYFQTGNKSLSRVSSPGKAVLSEFARSIAGRNS